MKKTLKTAITELISSEQGTVRLNSIAVLKRWTKSAINEDVDALVIRLEPLNAQYIKGFGDVWIESRDYAGIIEECNKAIRAFFEEAAEQMTSDLRAGYWKEGRA